MNVLLHQAQIMFGLMAIGTGMAAAMFIVMVTGHNQEHIGFGHPVHGLTVVVVTIGKEVPGDNFLRLFYNSLIFLIQVLMYAKNQQLRRTMFYKMYGLIHHPPLKNY